ncbi:MAG TPA: ElyC/SanA/YdcF family protein [Candidatus Saccharimonadales bacterium]|nr:ElyC/SanA/YdcF family protein [Candidatus Saccharimonadales bacterium]
MKSTIVRILHNLWQATLRRKWSVLGFVAALTLLPVIAIVVSSAIIGRNKIYILPQDTHTTARVGLVLGAGITPDGTPYKELRSRLDTAAAALQSGTVQKLLLSGDNRFKNYNEPEAMKEYLVTQKHISASQLQLDYAGRSTYESCQRAKQIFGLDRTIIFSAQSHLPRAIFLCRHFGVTAYGIASHIEANNHVRREALAGVKAFINAYIKGEPTVLGPPIPT